MDLLVEHAVSFSTYSWFRPRIYLPLQSNLLTIGSGFEFWNLTFTMPANSNKVPNIHFKVELA